jgi:hypothetical protein
MLPFCKYRKNYSNEKLQRENLFSKNISSSILLFLVFIGFVERPAVLCENDQPSVNHLWNEDMGPIASSSEFS